MAVTKRGTGAAELDICNLLMVGDHHSALLQTTCQQMLFKTSHDDDNPVARLLDNAAHFEAAVSKALDSGKTKLNILVDSSVIVAGEAKRFRFAHVIMINVDH
jgi:hypothetical protein